MFHKELALINQINEKNALFAIIGVLNILTINRSHISVMTSIIHYHIIYQ